MNKLRSAVSRTRNRDSSSAVLLLRFVFVVALASVVGCSPGLFEAIQRANAEAQFNAYAESLADAITEHGQYGDLRVTSVAHMFEQDSNPPLGIVVIQLAHEDSRDESELSVTCRAEYRFDDNGWSQPRMTHELKSPPVPKGGLRAVIQRRIVQFRIGEVESSVESLLSPNGELGRLLRRPIGESD